MVVEVTQLAFHQIRHRRIYEEIVEQVKAQITSGELRPGDRMLSEREISEQLGVSRATVREALTALEVIGLLNVRPGEGAFVQAPELDKQFEHLAGYLVLDRERLAEMYELRRVLEVACAARAAQRATREELEAIARALLDMEDDLQHGRLGEEADFRFHLAVAEGAHNSLMLRFMHTISDSLRHVMQVSRQKLYRVPGMPQQLLEEHRLIFAAIQAGNVQQAKDVMRRHLDGVASEVLQVQRV